MPEIKHDHIIIVHWRHYLGHAPGKDVNGPYTKAEALEIAAILEKNPRLKSLEIRKRQE